MSEETKPQSGIKVDVKLTNKDLVKTTAVIVGVVVAKYFVIRTITGAAARAATQDTTPKS